MKAKTKITEREKEYIKQNFWDMGGKACAKVLNRSYSGVMRVSKCLNLEVNPKFITNHQDLSCITDLKDPFAVYFLGYMWADGHIRKDKPRITFKIKEVDFADLKSQIHRLGVGWRYSEYIDKNHSNWSKLSVFSISHRSLWDFLVEKDYHIKSSTTPIKILSRIPDNLKHYWWRGYFDGDGSVSLLREGSLSFNSCLDQDWSFVIDLGKYLNIDFRIERLKRKTRGGSKAIISNYAYLKRFIEYMYAGESFGLSRKKERCYVYLNSDRVKKAETSSIYRGVCKRKGREGYLMQISCNNITYRNVFSNEIDAAKEYDKQAILLFGNKAKLNFDIV